MPTPELMTWVPSRRRWTRMHKGKRYWISCKALGVPETKEASIQAANAWWKAKQAEIDATSQPILRPLLPLEDITATLFAGYNRAFDDPSAVVSAVQGDEQVEYPLPDDMPVFFDPVTKRLLPGVPEPAVQAAIQAVSRLLMDRHIVNGEPLPETLARTLPAARLQQAKDGIAALRGEATAPAEKAVLTHYDRWVRRQYDQAQAGKITPGRADNNRICLQHFRDFLGETADIENCIDADHLDGFYLYCRKKMQERLDDPKRKAGWSADYAKKVFDTARRFIRDLWELKWIEAALPRNIDSKSFRFNVGAKAIKTWEPEEFKAVLAAAQTWRQMPLHLLLMANCGYRHQDIADIRQQEVDWTAGRIIRARSKIDDQENAPVVNYKLWPATFDLLRQHRNPDHSPHARVLLTASGKPWVWEELVDEPDGRRKLKSCNSINSNFAHLRKRLKFNKPLSEIRKMGASLLEKEFHKCVPEYLGESPESIKDKHYARPDQELFDRAVFWLGQQLGQVTADGKQAPPARPTKGRKK